MKIPFFLIDAFSSVPFKGNPAGVCLLDGEIPDRLMADIALEVGASETAFYEQRSGRLRWFTPKVEIDLCGHATLATVCALSRSAMLPDHQEITFKTKSGELRAKISEGLVEMNFPLAATVSPTSPNSELLGKLGISENPEFYGKSGTKTVIVVNTEDEVRHLTPDFAGLLLTEGFGVIVTAVSSTEYDFISRYFHPWAGVNEDPVTGSAHCVLARYWGDRLGKKRMKGYQASSRGGCVEVRILDESRVLLLGSGIISIQGQIETGCEQTRGCDAGGLWREQEKSPSEGKRSMGH